MAKLFERRLTPRDSPLAIFATTAGAFLAAMLITSFLFRLLRRESVSGVLRAFSRALRERCAVLAMRWCGRRRWR